MSGGCCFRAKTRKGHGSRSQNTGDMHFTISGRCRLQSGVLVVNESFETKEEVLVLREAAALGVLATFKLEVWSSRAPGYLGNPDLMGRITHINRASWYYY
jgi:hypothetical protein